MQRREPSCFVGLADGLKLQRYSKYSLGHYITSNYVITIVWLAFRSNLTMSTVVFSVNVGSGWGERSEKQSEDESNRWHDTDMFWFDIKSVAKVGTSQRSLKDKELHFNLVRLRKNGPYFDFSGTYVFDNKGLAYKKQGFLLFQRRRKNFDYFFKRVRA